MKTGDMICAVQEELGVLVDGRPGPQTWGAIYQRIVHPQVELQIAFTAPTDDTNKRSERVIATLLPHFQLRPAWAQDLSEGGLLAALRARRQRGQDIG